jgi:hypothetical protein
VLFRSVYGPANVLINGTPAIGQSVVIAAVAGAVKVLATLGDVIVGDMLETGVDTKYKPVFLRLG